MLSCFEVRLLTVVEVVAVVVVVVVVVALVISKSQRRGTQYYSHVSLSISHFSHYESE